MASNGLERLASLDEEELDALIELAQMQSGGVSRRDVVKGAGAVGLGALLGGGATGAASADASTSDSDPNIGSPSNRVDVFAEGVDANVLDVIEQITGDTATVSTESELDDHLNSTKYIKLTADLTGVSKKTITLAGTELYGPGTIEGSVDNDAILELSGNGIRLGNNLTVQNNSGTSGKAILISSGAACYLNNVIANAHQLGIHATGGFGHHIDNCRCVCIATGNPSGSAGISSGMTDIEIDEAHVNDFERGIVLSGDGSSIEGCHITGDDAKTIGIYADGLKRVDNNKVGGTSPPSDVGILLRGGGVSARGNEVRVGQNADGIRLELPSSGTLSRAIVKNNHLNGTSAGSGDEAVATGSNVTGQSQVVVIDNPNKNFSSAGENSFPTGHL